MTITKPCTALSKAATIREAASQIRDDTLVATRAVRPFLHAVADWLDAIGQELAETHHGHASCTEPSGNQAALTIARAYLDEERP